MPDEKTRRKAARGELKDRQLRDAVNEEMKDRDRHYARTGVPTGPSALAVECLYVKTNVDEDGTNRTFDYIWGEPGQHDFDAVDCQVKDPPAQDMPKLFGTDNLTFRNGSITGVRDGQGSHVEGVHINGCRNVLFEDYLFEDNDIFSGAFITQWGEISPGVPFPNPANITFRRCKFGMVGPGGGYFAVKVRDDGNGNYTPCPGLKFEDCISRMAFDTPGVDLSDVQFIGPSEPWPPFRTEGTDPDPGPEPEPPVDETLAERVRVLEEKVADLQINDAHQDARLDTIEGDMTTLG